MRGKPNTGVSQEKVLPQVGRGLPARASGVLTSLPVMFGATSELLHHFRLEGKLWGDARHAPDPLMPYMRPLFHAPSVFTSSYACLWPSEFQKLLGIPGRQGAPARGSRFQVAGGKVPERLTALAVPAPESGGGETGDLELRPSKRI